MKKPSLPTRGGDYQEKFPWIDRIKSVRDRITINELNERLVADLRSKSDDVKVWATAPEYIDPELIEGYKIGNNTELVQDIDKQVLLEAVGTENISLKTIKKIRVSAMATSSSASIIASWNGYRCLYAEVARDSDQVCLLVDGAWYEVDRRYVDEVNQQYSSISFTERDDFPGYTGDNEKAYNEILSKSTNGILCDAKLVYSKGRTGIELCDVYLHANGESAFVHIKRYSASSALSHLFSQGYVSAILMRSDADFRTQAQIKFSNQLEAGKIIYGIITSKPIKKFDLPFFSKVTFTNYYKQLTGMGYEVEITVIKDRTKSA